MKLLALFIIGVALGGCFESRTDTTGRERTTSHAEEHPTPDGGKTVDTTSTSTTESHAEQKTGIDMEALSTAITTAVRAAMAATGIPWGQLGTIVGGVGTAAAGAYALSKRGEAALHRKDSDQAWDRLLDLREKDDARVDAQKGNING